MDKEQINKAFDEVHHQVLQKSQSELESILADTKFSSDMTENLAQIAKVSIDVNVRYTDALVLNLLTRLLADDK
ncbi:hypothetical protein CT113_03885 [Levilactobacillus brevis]|nr:hypothetical protein CT113_03885 [Levilactobacillus brevis]KID42892.1 hypothetical protein LbDm2_2221 [Levilactobacillus brevis]MCS8597022.1 hypothetical protein [Levilactobacillus brevis]